jgi:hypothetical protein
MTTQSTGAMHPIIAAVIVVPIGTVFSESPLII